MAERDKSLHPIKYYREHLNCKVRPDHRAFDQFRPVQINLGSIATADGSALVKIGDTIVVCGIKAELCKPKAETPNQGYLVPNIELPPLCCSKFRPGPPSEQAQVYTQTVAQIIENSGCINLKDLCLHNDKLAWCLYADLICLNFDGSVIDACVIALITALKTLTLPVVDYDPALDNKQVNLEERKAVRVRNIPVSTSFSIFDDEIILTDPTAEEEDLCTGTVTVVTTNGQSSYILKPGGSPLSDEDMFTFIETGKNRETQIVRLISEAINNVNN